ncbi:MAG: response regulator [Pirellulaceae bacterium]|nr:response regulator [Pirellulaceae bacterium]
MSNVLRLAIVDPNDTTRDAIKGILLGMEFVWLEAECSRYEFFGEVVEQTHPDIGVVNIDHDREKALDLISSLQRNCPKTSILVVSESTEGHLILQAMRAGAKEFVTQPVSLEDLICAIERIGNQLHGHGAGKSRNCVTLAVGGASGGVGATSLAVNLACNLARDEKNSVALVDLDLSLGDADVFLDAIPDYTVVDVAQNITRLDFDLLKRSLTKHSSGLYLLPRPVQLQEGSSIVAEDLQRVFGLLKASFSHLVIDVSKSFSPLDLVAFEAANHVLLATHLNLPCIRNLVRLLKSFDEIEGLCDKIKVVVNRLGLDHGQISLKKAEATIGREIFWKIPNDSKTMVAMRDNGVPLIEQSPRANITQSLLALAETLCRDGAADLDGDLQNHSTGRWFRFWNGKGKTTLT